LEVFFGNNNVTSIFIAVGNYLSISWQYMFYVVLSIIGIIGVFFKKPDYSEVYAYSLTMVTIFQLGAIIPHSLVAAVTAKGVGVYIAPILVFILLTIGSLICLAFSYASFQYSKSIKRTQVYDQSNSFNIYVKICSILTTAFNLLCLGCVFLGSISLIILLFIPGVTPSVTPSQQNFERYQFILLMVSNYFTQFFNYSFWTVVGIFGVIGSFKFKSHFTKIFSYALIVVSLFNSSYLIFQIFFRNWFNISC